MITFDKQSMNINGIVLLRPRQWMLHFQHNYRGTVC